jgi:hypothetical protein
LDDLILASNDDGDGDDDKMARYNYMLMWVDIPNFLMKTYQVGMNL